MHIWTIILFSLVVACHKDEVASNQIRQFSKGLKQPSLAEPIAEITLAKVEELKEKSDIIIRNSEIKKNIIYLYSGGLSHGNIGGRTGAQTFCNRKIDDAIGLKVVPFLLFQSDKGLKNLVSESNGGSPVQALPSQKKIANSWRELFSSPESADSPKMIESIAEAGVFGKITDNVSRYEGLFWSGVTGTEDMNTSNKKVNCNDWEDLSGWGRVGGNQSNVHPKKMNSPVKWKFPWYDYGITMSCDTRQHVLCVVFRLDG